MYKEVLTRDNIRVHLSIGLGETRYALSLIACMELLHLLSTGTGGDGAWGEELVAYCFIVNRLNTWEESFEPSKAWDIKFRELLVETITEYRMRIWYNLDEHREFMEHWGLTNADLPQLIGVSDDKDEQGASL